MSSNARVLRGVLAAVAMMGTVLVAAPRPAEAVTSPTSFCDVPADTFYANAVTWGRTSGVVAGRNDIRFAPDAPTTRGQIVTLLYRFVTWQNGGAAPAANGPNPFSDVPEGAFYERAVRWALEQGVTTGKTPTSFDPEGPTTREQLAALIHRLQGGPSDWPVTDHFVDIGGSSFPSEISWMYDTGITAGTGPQSFSPSRVVTRAEIVTFLWRLGGQPAAPAVDPGCTFTAIGDSVMLGAVLYDNLGSSRFPGWTGAIEVGVCRWAVIDLDNMCGPGTIPSALSVIEAAVRSNTLGDVVVIHVGTNDSTFSAADFDRIVEAAAGAEEIYFVNLRSRNPWVPAVNAVIEAGVQRWQSQRSIGLLDWHGLTAATPGLLETDGTHLTGAGARAFNDLIARALDG